MAQQNWTGEAGQQGITDTVRQSRRLLRVRLAHQARTEKLHPILKVVHVPVPLLYLFQYAAAVVKKKYVFCVRKGTTLQLLRLHRSSSRQSAARPGSAMRNSLSVTEVEI